MTAPSLPQRPTEHHRKLYALAGSWSGEEMIYPTPGDRGGRASARVESRVSLDGFFLFTDYVEEREGAAPYSGHGVFGWDDALRTFTMHWFDSMGSLPATAARGKWEGSVLTFEQRTHEGYARYIYVFESSDRYLFRIESSKDGREWLPFVEGRYRRAGS
jgi:hypothetical protein